jgi:aquaporin Z
MAGSKAISEVLKNHWPEYLIEGTCLAVFMVSAFTFGTILEHPASPIHQVLGNPVLRRFFMGLAMGSTAIAIVYSPWGKRSGAHINPSTTLTFLRLGKIDTCDAIFYVAAQFIGGSIGAVSAAIALSAWASHPAVNYVVTMPGVAGAFAALIAEMTIAFILMSVVLQVSSTPKLQRFTGLCAGILVAIYITVEAPISGMSMNPARTFASALPAHYWAHLWIYFVGPVIGMSAAAELYLRTWGVSTALCAKLHHENTQRCIFCGKPAGV